MQLPVRSLCAFRCDRMIRPLALLASWSTLAYTKRRMALLAWWSCVAYTKRRLAMTFSFKWVFHRNRCRSVVGEPI